MNGFDRKQGLEVSDTLLPRHGQWSLSLDGACRKDNIDTISEGVHSLNGVHRARSISASKRSDDLQNIVADDMHAMWASAEVVVAHSPRKREQGIGGTFGDSEAAVNPEHTKVCAPVRRNVSSECSVFLSGEMSFMKCSNSPRCVLLSGDMAVMKH